MPNNNPSSGNKNLVRLLSVILLVLIIIIILLLLRSCGASEGNTVLEPDYPTMSVDPGAEEIEDDPSPETPPTVTQGGGSVTISFMDNITYTLSTGKLSLFYQNPGASTHNVVVQVILVRGEDEYLLAQSGIMEPGYQVTSLNVDSNAPQLSEGGYEGKMRLRFYDRESGERAIVDTDIPCTVTVTQ